MNDMKNINGMYGFGRMGGPVHYWDKGNPGPPKNKHIILKIVLLIWLICTICGIKAIVQEKSTWNNSTVVTALVTDCLMRETYDSESGSSNIEYVTSVRWTLDKTYEGKTYLNQRYKEGDYIAINVDSNDYSRIVRDPGSVAGTIFIVLVVSFSALLVIILIYENISK